MHWGAKSLYWGSWCSWEKGKALLRKVRLEWDWSMAHLVEKVKEHPRKQTECARSRAEGSFRRWAAIVAAKTEWSEWVGPNLCQITSFSFPKDTGEPLKGFQERDAMIRFVFWKAHGRLLCGQQTWRKGRVTMERPVRYYRPILYKKNLRLWDI